MRPERPQPRIGRVRDVRLLSPDPAASRAFYSAVTLRQADASASIGFEAGGVAEPATGWVVGFGTRRLEQAMAACLRCGGRLLVDESDHGRVVIADPRGVPFALVAVGQPDLAPIEGEVVLADIYTRDVEGAVRFYPSALELELDVLPDEPVDYLMLSADRRHVAGVLDMRSFLEPSTADQWVPYFHFSSLDPAIERATALGAWVVVPTTPSPTGPFALLRDPQGCLFGVWNSPASRQQRPRPGPAAGALSAD